MTWVIGASSVFGVGLLVSDVRVSLRNGQRRDMLRKVYALGPYIGLGFAGSVACGFAIWEVLQSRYSVATPPGKAYEPEGWELWAPVTPLYNAGDYAAAADRAREVADANPQYAGLFYNLACCESLAGRTDDAIQHLGRAIELSERFRAFAKGDSDFDPIRDEPAFRQLVDV